jgi:hypothetical protein
VLEGFRGTQAVGVGGGVFKVVRGARVSELEEARGAERFDRNQALPPSDNPLPRSSPALRIGRDPARRAARST